jgi:hypothetical protein
MMDTSDYKVNEKAFGEFTLTKQLLCAIIRYEKHGMDAHIVWLLARSAIWLLRLLYSVSL